MKYCDSCHGTFPNSLDVCPRDQGRLRTVSEFAAGMTVREKYQIVDKIGAGGMAMVYRARHLAFGEVFALKVVSPLLADNEEFLARFKNEAIITRRLRHPNAVRVDDLDVTDDGRPFIVMEYVEGMSVRKAIQTDGALPVPRALSIARQTALALGAAHQLGIVHRDIKPDNVLLVRQPDGTELAKVLDFGIAKVREGAMELTGNASPTQTGMIVGTPQYISPEQALGMRGDDIDGRADIYSLGVVLYEMLTGELPFRSDTPMGMMLHHIQTPAISPRDLRPDLAIPQTLADVLMKTLAKDPGRRFQSADELVQALSRPHDGAVTTVERAVRPLRPTVRPSASPSNPARRPVSLRPEPLAGGHGFAPSRGMLMAGVVGVLILGFVALWPTVPSRSVVPRTHTIEPAPEPLGWSEAAVPAAAGPEDAPAGATPDDAHILAEVSRRLTGSEALREASLEPTVERGVVTLSGRASATQIEVARALALSVDGVSEVRSAATVADAPPAGEAEAPSDPRVRELVDEGYVLLNQEQPDAAAMKFTAALEIEPGHPTARLGLQRARAKLSSR